MGKDLTAALRPAISLLLLLTLITGLLYPLVILGLGQAIFPHQANGSLVRNGDRIVGSELIGQAFDGPTYFHTRPSAAGDGYDASASSGSNLGPTSAILATNIGERVAAARAEGVTGLVPAHLATASGSGLDPHISPTMAYAQATRVTAARNLSEAQVRQVVERAIRRPALGVLGEAHVSVLALNRELDRISASGVR